MTRAIYSYSIMICRMLYYTRAVFKPSARRPGRPARLVSRNYFDADVGIFLNAQVLNHECKCVHVHNL